jgi:hypothetical protein
MGKGIIRAVALIAASFALASPRAAQAATIAVGPGDSYQKIESAQAGDEVVIAPGTYTFRVHLTKVGTATAPIVIRAEDPARPPVWDLSSVLVENAPGSYTAGDRGRGCWQISGGAHYRISGIVFKDCHNAGHNSAGMRYYNGASGILLRDCVFRANDNGLTGGTGDSSITVEYSEFDGNGSLQASSSAPSHNLYIYGGTFTLRYSYVHDPVQAQNFHIRSSNSVIEYNWFARAKSYEGDLMSNDDLSGVSAVRQTMLLRGNVIVQNAQPGNTGQVIAVYNDGQVAGLSFSVRLVNNTFVGNGGHAALVHLSNADNTVMSAELVNNIVSGTSVVTLVEDAASATVTGTNNWIATGAIATGLSASIVGAGPGFANAAAKDFTLASGSGAIGKAATAADLPGGEYYRDEQVVRMGRVRAAAKDLGAFESTTSSAPAGPYGAPISGPADAGADAPIAVDAGAQGVGGASGAGGGGGATAAPDSGSQGGGGSGGAGGASAAGGTVGAGGSVIAGGSAGAAGSGGSAATPVASESSGCGCDLAARSARGAWLLVALAAAAAAVRRRA